MVQGDFVAGLNADLPQQDIGVLADEVLVHRAVLPARGRLAEDRLQQTLGLRRRDLKGAVADHGALEIVGDRADGEDLLLVGADDVVVERTAEDDVAAGLLEIGRFIHDDRRVAGSGADGSLPAGHRRSHNGDASGHGQQTDILMAHDLLGGVDGRLGDPHDQVVWTAGLGDALLKKLNGVIAAALGRWVGVEDNRVPGGDHGDGVADDGRRRVGARHDGPNHPVRRVLDERHATVARPGRRLQDFGAGRLVDVEQVLLDLVFVAPHARFLHGLVGQQLSVLAQQAAHVRDHLLT